MLVQMWQKGAHLHRSWRCKVPVSVGEKKSLVVPHTTKNRFTIRLQGDSRPVLHRDACPSVFTVPLFRIAELWISKLDVYSWRIGNCGIHTRIKLYCLQKSWYNWIIFKVSFRQVSCDFSRTQLLGSLWIHVMMYLYLTWENSHQGEQRGLMGL